MGLLLSIPMIPSPCPNLRHHPDPRSLLDSSPNEGLLVLLRQRGFDVRSCGTADGVTCVPCSWIEFYAQRR